MALPLPNLDTRTWDDLVKEGLARIVRYSPAWTDHNASDPGVTLIELIAQEVEREIFRCNRIGDAQRRKYLALAGPEFLPRGPRPAAGLMKFRLRDLATQAGENAPPRRGIVPLGAELKRDLTASGREGPHEPDSDVSGPPPLVVRTDHFLTVHNASIQCILSFDGLRFRDLTRQRNAETPFLPWGEDPAAADADEHCPALYLGFAPFPNLAAFDDGPLTLWLRGVPRVAGRDEASRLRHDPSVLPPRLEGPDPLPHTPHLRAPEGAIELVPADRFASGHAPPQHPSVSVEWEISVNGRWEALECEDWTRALTLDGPVRFSFPKNKNGQRQSSTEAVVGAMPLSLVYIRCRLKSGRPDEAPLLSFVDVNVASTVQSVPMVSAFDELLKEGKTSPFDKPHPRSREREGQVKLIAAAHALPLVHTRVGEGAIAAEDPKVSLPSVAWVADTPGARPRRVVLPLIAYEDFDRLAPDGRARLWLDSAPVLPESLRVFSIEPGAGDSWTLASWTARHDWDLSGPRDWHYVLEPGRGVVVFGDGERGRALSAGALVVAAASTTSGLLGNTLPRGVWSLDLKADRPTQLLPALTRLTPWGEGVSAMNPVESTGGADEETVARAQGRLVDSLRAPDQLLELASATRSGTLDGLDLNMVLAIEAPAQAVAPVDFERLALDTPGTPMRRARAFAGLDPSLPDVSVPGTITVVVVPGLPVKRPMPGRETLARVAWALERRRAIGTRLIVIGPDYVEVTIQATLRARPRQGDPAEIVDRARDMVRKFFDPLVGGPLHRGWPMGRAVYRGEVLALLDSVSGVDRVESLKIFAVVGGQSVLVPLNHPLARTQLVASGDHVLEVLAE